MVQQRTASILLVITAVLFVLTGALHLMAFGSINALAQSATPDDIHALLPAVWIALGIDLLVMGGIIAAVGLENSSGGRYVLAAAAIVPWGSALLQLIYFGLIGPTYLLLLDGGLAIACAVVREPRRRRSEG